MSYEIPQELKYKEKIVFNLDFEQLVYAVIFSFFVILVFKTSFSLYTKITLSSFLVLIGVLFMFLDFKNTISNYISWLNFRDVKFLSDKMNRFMAVNDIKQKHLEIRNYKNNLLNKFKQRTTYDINKVAILRVNPINFGIKPNEEKEAIIKNFQKFLNSIDFNIQILIKTEELDLEKYYNSLESNVIKKYKPYFDDYKKQIRTIIEERAVKNKNFYIIIREKSDLEIQVNICVDRLKLTNIRVTRLNKEEILKLLKDYFEAKPKIATSDVSRENYYNYLISPKAIKNNIDYFEIDNKYYRTIYAHGYPRTVEAGFLDKIITTTGNFDISIHIDPFDIELMIVKINKELQKQRADLYSLKKRNILNTSLQIKYRDTKNILEELQRGKQKLFNLSLYINIKADSKNELDLLTKKIEAELNSILIIPKIPIFRMHKGIKSVLPYSSNELNVKRNITSEALSAFFPFTSQFLDFHQNGVLLGLNKNNIPIIKDIYSLGNSNGFILASSGFGKSFYAKLFIIRQLLTGTKIYVIDPQNEYVNICKKFKGQLIKINRSSKTIINPLDLMGHDYAEKRLSLMDLMQIMLGKVTEIQKAVLDRALTLTYERKGINSRSETWSNKAPILKDLLHELELMGKKASLIEKQTYRSLTNRLSMYTDGVFSFLNKETQINFNNNFIVFNIGEMPKQVKPVIMFLILDYVYMKMRSDKDKKLLVIDEAWSLLNRIEDSSYIFEIVKTSRKFNLALLLITQEVDDLIKSDAGNSVLANSAYTILLRQKPAVIESIMKTFYLSESEKDLLMTSSIGNGLVIMENDHTELHVISSKEEYDLVNTNPNETSVKKERKIKQEKKEIYITLDLDKRFFIKNKLTKEEIEFLLHHDYVISSHIGLDKGRYQEYMLKPHKNESSSHFFLIYVISDYIRKFTKEVCLYNTLKPDIVFKVKNKEIAIEVETGTNSKKDLMNKVENLNSKYKEWYFVLDDFNLKYKYERYGKCLLRSEVIDKINQLFKNRNV